MTNAWFETLVTASVLAPIDAHLVATLERARVRSGGDPLSPLERLGAAVAARAVGQGHVCADLERVVVDPPVNADGASVADFEWPPLADWLEALASSELVHAVGSESEAPRPLVLDGTRLYLERYFVYERRLAAALARRAHALDDIDADTLEDGVRRLFPDAEGRERLQASAARSAVRRQLAVISGGPGTGKTRTVARILALIVEQARRSGLPVPRMELVAPTGKAAQRLGEAIAKNLTDGLDVAPEVAAAIPVAAATIHRRLGVLPDEPTAFRHNEDNPLFADVVLVDEASMVDLALMAKLVQAVPPSARLILLGDRDQLASVEAGAVYGDICRAAGSPGSALAGVATHLTEVFRTSATGGIAALAAAIRDGDSAKADGLLRAAAGGVRLVSPGREIDPVAAIADEVLSGYQPLARATNPAEALAALDGYRVLCAHRRGPNGATRVGLAIERVLVERGHLHPDAARPGVWYPGRPVIVTQNDYQLELFNGDVGVCVAEPASDGTSRLRVWFPPLGADVEPRAFAPARLPPHETCFAMTVHKSQGSEFDRVAVVLPDEISPICTRELLYTGVTRARTSATVVASPEVVRAAVERQIVRASGLPRALHAGG